MANKWPVIVGDLQPPTEYFEETNSFTDPSVLPTYGDFYGARIAGQDLPNFYSRLRRGELLPYTNWHKVEMQASYSGERNYFDSNGNTYRQPKPHQNYWNGAEDTYITEAHLLSIRDEHLSLIDNQVTRAINTLKSSVHDSATFLAELHKTVRMFRGAVKRFINLLVRAKPHEWAQLWLEGRYGWRVLMYDLQSINDAIENLTAVSVSGIWSAKKPLKISDQKTELSSTGGTYWDADIVKQYTQTVQVLGMAKSKLKPPSFGGDVLVTGWELLPFSFVVDMFFNIGTKLQYLSGLMLRSDIRSAYGVKITCEGTCSSTIVKGDKHPSLTMVSPSTGYAKFKSTLLLRVPFEPSILPTVQVRLDGFKVLDLMSLLEVTLNKDRKNRSLWDKDAAKNPLAYIPGI